MRWMTRVLANALLVDLRYGGRVSQRRRRATESQPRAGGGAMGGYWKALPVIWNVDPGSTRMLPSAELVMVTLVSVALPRAPPCALIPAPLLDLSMRTLVMA